MSYFFLLIYFFLIDFLHEAAVKNDKFGSVMQIVSIQFFHWGSGAAEAGVATDSPKFRDLQEGNVGEIGWTKGKIVLYFTQKKLISTVTGFTNVKNLINNGKLPQ